MSDFSRQRFASPQVRRNASVDGESALSSNKKSSVYKLENGADATPNRRHANLDSMFKSLPERDKNEILNRIHKVRVKTIEQSLAGAMQESSLTAVEKEKVLEQYFQMKRQLNKAAV